MSFCKRVRVLLFLSMLFLSGMAPALEVKVMNYNIRYGSADDGANSWTNRSALLIAQLKEQAPQVMGMQEALRFQIDEIRKALPYYGEVGIGRDGGEEVGLPPFLNHGPSILKWNLRFHFCSCGGQRAAFL